MDEGKKNKWSWKDEPLKANGLKEDGIHVNINDKKYYWCTNHNDNKGKWVIHHPLTCENATRGREEEQGHHNANVTAFDTFEDDSTSSVE